jgi:hypothetical protein
MLLPKMSYPKRQAQIGPKNTAVITEPDRLDVRLGRGRSYRQNEGNRFFEGTLKTAGTGEGQRYITCKSAHILAHSFLALWSYSALISLLHDRYAAARKIEGKKRITEEIVSAVKQTGRFLKRNNRTQTWEEVSDAVARIKVAQALQYISRKRLSEHCGSSISSVLAGKHGSCCPSPIHGVPSYVTMPRLVDFNTFCVHQEHQQSNSVLGRLLPTFEPVIAQATAVSDSSSVFLMGEDDYVSDGLPPPDTEAISVDAITSPGWECEDDPNCARRDDLESSSTDDDVFSLISEESETSVSSVEDWEYTSLPLITSTDNYAHRRHEHKSKFEPLLSDEKILAALGYYNALPTTTYDQAVQRPAYRSGDVQHFQGRRRHNL